MTQQRAIKTRAGVITAAAHEFADRGYAGASINSIIANSTSTKGALYFHFPSKEALAGAVLDNVRAAYSRIAERRRSVDIHPFDAIAGIVDDIAAVATGVSGRAEMKLALDPPSTELQRPSDAWEAAIRNYAVTAEQAGFLRSGFTAERFTNFLLATLAGHRILADMIPAHSDRPDLRDLFADTVQILVTAAATQDYLHSRVESGERTTPAAAGTNDQVSER